MGGISLVFYLLSILMKDMFFQCTLCFSVFSLNSFHFHYFQPFLRLLFCNNHRSGMRRPRHGQHWYMTFRATRHPLPHHCTIATMSTEHHHSIMPILNQDGVVKAVLTGICFFDNCNMYRVISCPLVPSSTCISSDVSRGNDYPLPHVSHSLPVLQVVPTSSHTF